MAKRIAEIAGAGLSGLMLAARLAQLGWTVNLHERSKDLRMFGAGIWLWENGLKSLKVVGAYDDAVANAKKINQWRIVDHRGKTLMTRSFTADDKMLVPPRADLYQALIDRVQELGVNIFTSSVVVGARSEGSLLMENGDERLADLVVGADGNGSRIRESINGSRWVDYGVESGIRMLIEHREGDPEDTITEYWNGPWRLMYNPCTGGQDYIFLGAPIGDPRTQMPVDREIWKDTFPQLSTLIPRLQEDGRWDRIINIKCRTWSEGRVAIVGDAAHAMPPNLGQAANTAFANVLALAAAVDEASDIPQALVRWEQRQRPMTDHVQWFSYIYGYVVAKWPLRFQTMRSDLIRSMATMDWFTESLNRGAWHVPAGYEAIPR
ncbi:FAD-dependent oxidoreductase [Oceanibacterium hippocampi]|uniref:3-hydroxybenzoate 6-hydroxylase 1 n=1 Tax=Oceanibacterium hippocampi TaxID=745714 RepID=A0A1Y5TWM3_9PROT|nr:NAD(P)/FAD-dependent oxidoreductase [Oceanibacterium hippocampi]SLN72180.1 3-hydroxybenzoate 6-hydroxylase 1 [Oceanibacterium hippocampi]